MAKPEPSAPPPPKLPDFTPFIVLAAVLGVLLLGLYLFPLFKGIMVYQDCVATGRTNCARG